MNEREEMNCDKFFAMGLDPASDATLNDTERAEAQAHSDICSRCAALEDSWRSAKEELSELGQASITMGAPARVEMRLRQQFRMQHRSTKIRQRGLIAAWALAAAAVVVISLSWNDWHGAQKNWWAGRTPVQQTPASDSVTRIADADISDFTALPGSIPGSQADAVLRVRMQRGSLGTLGIPVNEERAADWIDVDLLVGADGSPEGVRLLE